MEIVKLKNGGYARVARVIEGEHEEIKNFPEFARQNSQDYLDALAKFSDGSELPELLPGNGPIFGNAKVGEVAPMLAVSALAITDEEQKAIAAAKEQ